MFADELLAAYPDAKIVLTERDADSWLVSMEKTFYVLLGWKSLYYLAPLGPVTTLHPPLPVPEKPQLTVTTEAHRCLLESLQPRRQYLDKRRHPEPPEAPPKLSRPLRPHPPRSAKR